MSVTINNTSNEASIMKVCPVHYKYDMSTGSGRFDAPSLYLPHMFSLATAVFMVSR